MSPAASLDEVTTRLRSAVANAFTAYTAAAQAEREDRRYDLTMSGLGGCTRQAAYRLAGTPPSEKLIHGQMREANIGTMIHIGLLPLIATELGGTEEIDVELTVDTLHIQGRADLYSPELRLLSDLKTVGGYRFAALGDDATPAHRLQVAGYALAAIQSGKPVDWIAWIYLDRSSGAEHLVIEPWSDQLVDLVKQRCAELDIYASEPGDAPRDERGPGLSYVCDGCPWLRECWGTDAAPGVIGAQRVLARDHDGVERALRLYDNARAREREATDEKEFARAMFASQEPGLYGKFEFRFSAGRDVVDKDSAVELLRAAGIPLPVKAGPSRLIVRRSR